MAFQVVLQTRSSGAVAAEATGSYWKPVYNLLETAGKRLIVGEAGHMKMVPGPKPDTKDAEWMCEILHGETIPSLRAPC